MSVRTLLVGGSLLADALLWAGVLLLLAPAFYKPHRPLSIGQELKRIFKTWRPF